MIPRHWLMTETFPKHLYARPDLRHHAGIHTYAHPNHFLTSQISLYVISSICLKCVCIYSRAPVDSGDWDAIVTRHGVHFVYTLYLRYNYVVVIRVPRRRWVWSISIHVVSMTNEDPPFAVSPSSFGYTSIYICERLTPFNHLSPIVCECI